MNVRITKLDPQASGLKLRNGDLTEYAESRYGTSTGYGDERNRKKL